MITNIIHSKYWNFDFKIIFFEIFRKGKINQKIKMKGIGIALKCIKIECNFHIFKCKIMKIFSIFLKFRLFWIKCSVYFRNLVGKSFRNTHLKITFNIFPFVLFLNEVYIIRCKQQEWDHRQITTDNKQHTTNDRWQQMSDMIPELPIDRHFLDLSEICLYSGQFYSRNF